ncbi:hypothetical protein DL765_006534 [Monosporascus sp. GIB2]|nr:hypothetical protein DL765_006534 [Monosporascus sp. GIB2]
MASYVITGVSKGLGFEFLRQISADSNNTVIGIVRDKPTTDKKVSEELSGRSNVHILQADVTDYNALEQAVAETARITGGSLDYLIANAGYVSWFDAFDPIGDLGNKPRELEEDLNKGIKVNVTANIHLFNLYMPLILKGQVKKVIAISSGLADLDSITKFELEPAPLYSISKAALNIAVAKFHAQYKKDGVLFISISPGVADVGHYNHITQEQLQRLGGMMQKFKLFAPDFKGPTTPELAVKDVISVWKRASVENGDGGTFVSHKGNKEWLAAVDGLYQESNVPDEIVLDRVAFLALPLRPQLVSGRRSRAIVRRGSPGPQSSVPKAFKRSSVAKTVAYGWTPNPTA